MKSISIPFNESMAFELTNSRGQKFLVWCEPAKTQFEIYLSLNNRKELLQTMVLIPSAEHENIVLMDYRFDVEAVFVNLQGTVISIQHLTRDEQKQKKFLFIDEFKFVILASPGFSKQFSLEPGQSKVEIPSNLRFSLHEIYKSAVDLKKPTFNEIFKHILEEKNGSGLRSKIPSHYLWYHDLLFLVGKISFPGYAASLPQREITRKLVSQLKESGINPIVKEAVYRRHLMSSPEQITKEDTWYGMENRGKFITTNYIGE